MSASVAFVAIAASIALAPFFFACNVHLAFDNPVLKVCSLALSAVALVVWIPWIVVTSPVSLFFLGYAYFVL